MQRRDLSKLLLSSAAAAIATDKAEAQSCMTPCHPQTAVESAAGVVPANTAYFPGDIRRYGATGGPAGSAPSRDDSAAFASACEAGHCYIPEGWAFKVVTGANAPATVTIEGDGPNSQLYCDGTILTAANGSYSQIRNIWIGNVTAPLTIQRYVEDVATTTASTTAGSNQITVANTTGLAVGMEVTGPNVWERAIITAIAGSVVTLSRNCTTSGSDSPVRFYAVTWNQGSAALATLANSNADGRYTPNVNDTDVWPKLTTQQKQEARIGPVVSLSGDHIVVEKIYGRRLSIFLLNGSYCDARDCDFQGGWSWAGIAFLNDRRGLRTKHNRAVSNRIHDHGFNGILFQGCDGIMVADNIISGVGESGIKTYQDSGQNDYWDGCSGVNSFNNKAFACYQGAFDYTGRTKNIGNEARASSSLGDQAHWCMMGFGFSGSNWTIDVVAEFVGGNLGPPNNFHVSDSKISGSFRENNILPVGGYNAINVTGQNNIVTGLRAYQETTRNTGAIFLINGPTAMANANALVDCDFRDSVASTLNIDVYTRRENCRANGAQDCPPAGQPFALVYMNDTESQTISHTGGVCAIRFGTDQDDEYGLWDNVNYRYVNLPAGRYQVNATVAFKASGTAKTDLRLYLSRNNSQNLSDCARVMWIPAASGDMYTLSVSEIVRISALTDCIQALAWTQNTDMVVSGANGICALSIERLGD